MLKSRAKELGIEAGSRLERVLAAKNERQAMLKENRAPDYSLTLRQIAKTQAAIGTLWRRWSVTRRCS